MAGMSDELRADLRKIFEDGMKRIDEIIAGIGKKNLKVSEVGSSNDQVQEIEESLDAGEANDLLESGCFDETPNFDEEIKEVDKIGNQEVGAVETDSDDAKQDSMVEIKELKKNDDEEAITHIGKLENPQPFTYYTKLECHEYSCEKYYDPDFMDISKWMLLKDDYVLGTFVRNLNVDSSKPVRLFLSNCFGHALHLTKQVEFIILNLPTPIIPYKEPLIDPPLLTPPKVPMLSYCQSTNHSTPFNPNRAPNFLDQTMIKRLGFNISLTGGLFVTIANGSELMATEIHQWEKGEAQGMVLTIEFLILPLMGTQTYKGRNSKYIWLNGRVRKKGKLMLGANNELRPDILKYFHNSVTGGSIFKPSMPSVFCVAFYDHGGFDAAADIKTNVTFFMESDASRVGYSNIASVDSSSRAKESAMKMLKFNKERVESKKGHANGLFVFHVQSRVTGAEYFYQWMTLAQQTNWHVLLDAGSLVPKDMDSLGLSLFRPDFVIMPFYWLLGYDPTGMGCLIIKKSMMENMQNQCWRHTESGMMKNSPVYPRGIAGRRALVGTILANKVAGTTAEAGPYLADVASEAKRASEMVGTMGIALSVFPLPGKVTSVVADLQPVDVVVSHVLKQKLSSKTNSIPITGGNRVVFMINGLVAIHVMELIIAVGKTVPKLQLEFGLAVEKVYTGSFMTSLDMAGVSISIMKTDQTLLQRIDASTKVPQWPVGSTVVNDKVQEVDQKFQISKKSRGIVSIILDVFMNGSSKDGRKQESESQTSGHSPLCQGYVLSTFPYYSALVMHFLKVAYKFLHTDPNVKVQMVLKPKEKESGRLITTVLVQWNKGFLKDSDWECLPELPKKFQNFILEDKDVFNKGVLLRAIYVGGSELSQPIAFLLILFLLH